MLGLMYLLLQEAKELQSRANDLQEATRASSKRRPWAVEDSVQEISDVRAHVSSLQKELASTSCLCVRTRARGRARRQRVAKKEGVRYRVECADERDWP